MALHIGMVTIDSTDPRSLADLSTKDRVAEVARLRGIGAGIVDEVVDERVDEVVDGHQLPGFAWTVLTDPDGNVFGVGAEE